VNLALAATDHFNRFIGLGPAVVTRERLVQTAPRALDEDQQRDLIRAAEHATARPGDRRAAAAHRGLTPTLFEHVNPLGTYDFRTDRPA
jgi:hypothetical protein